MKVYGVEKNSIAEELGIEKGDDIVKINGYPFVDVLDYEYCESQAEFTMTVKAADGFTCELYIEKEPYETIGLDFADSGIDMIQCRNNCLFCFVNQLPKGRNLRETLSVKDDDYRHSFISGTYITLTNLSEQEIERIIRLKLSPLYVSVHSTDEKERLKLLGIKRARPIMETLQRLSDAGIILHTQIVYCPTINEDIEQYIDELLQLAHTLAIVPVGLTDFANPMLSCCNSDNAKRVIDIVEKKQAECLAARGSRFVWCSDEFYVLAGRKVPLASCYEGFGQIENGVGLLAKFNEDFDYAIEMIDEKHQNFTPKNEKIAIATGVSAYNFISGKAEILCKKYGIDVTVHRIENNFFGKTVTVAGLLTAQDIASGLVDKPQFDKLILPSVMLKEFGDMFLDNSTTDDLSKTLNKPVEIIQPDGESFVYGLLGLKRKDM